jgi:hypothetical protein
VPSNLAAPSFCSPHRKKPDMYITTRKVRQVLLSILIGALIGGGLMWIGIARARADGVLSAMEQEDGDRYGRIYCSAIDDTPNINGVFIVMQSVMSDGFTADNAADVINYTVLTYCPRHWGLLTAIGNAARSGGHI